jgi:hypothetical protein
MHAVVACLRGCFRRRVPSCGLSTSTIVAVSFRTRTPSRRAGTVFRSVVQACSSTQSANDPPQWIVANCHEATRRHVRQTAALVAANTRNFRATPLDPERCPVCNTEVQVRALWRPRRPLITPRGCWKTTPKSQPSPHSTPKLGIFNKSLHQFAFTHSL